MGVVDLQLFKILQNSLFTERLRTAPSDFGKYMKLILQKIFEFLVWIWSSIKRYLEHDIGEESYFPEK